MHIECNEKSAILPILGKVWFISIDIVIKNMFFSFGLN